MSGMAEVLRIHSPIGRDENGQYCKGCNHRYGYAAERTLHQRACDHIAAMLTAAGFGPVKGEKRLMQLAALMAYEAVEENVKREAAAAALEEAANDPALRLSGHSGISITKLRTRAAAVQGAS